MGRKIGRYELLAPLGRGGMAEVFLARRRGPGGVEKRLVIKRIRRERAGDARFLELFVQEARLSMSLAHRNIVPVFDFGRAGNELFLVMEHVDGHDLRAALRRARAAEEPLDPVLVAFIGLEACQALDYAQRARSEDGRERPVVHRDVTPGNVLLSFSGEVKLTDFGIAIGEASLDAEGKVRGTPAYMSPEQARGEAVDLRSDLFSLGVVLFEALAGRPAYRGAGHDALEAARLGDLPPLPDSVPAALREVVERATQKEREERYEDAREMQLALDRYLVEARSRAGGQPPTYRLASWLRRLFPREESAGGSGAPAKDALKFAFAPTDVITFLEDGLEKLAGEGSGAAASDAVAESAGETVGETVLETSVERGDEDQDKKSAPRKSRRAGALFWLAGAGGAAAAIGLIAVIDLADSRPRAGSAPEASIEAGDPDDVERAGAEAARDAAPPAADGGPPLTQAEAPGASERTAKAPPDAGAGDRRRGDRTTAKRGRRPPGILKVSSRPWARVSVVGEGLKCRDTPCTIRLAPGTYRVELWNPVAKLGKEIEVEVASGETGYVREVLTRESVDRPR